MNCLCFLCLQTTNSVINIFEGLEESFVMLDVPSIIEKYVHFKPDVFNPMLCDKCWNTIESFYIFCLKVEEAQKKIKFNQNVEDIKMEEIKVEIENICLDIPYDEQSISNDNNETTSTLLEDVKTENNENINSSLTQCVIPNSKVKKKHPQKKTTDNKKLKIKLKKLENNEKISIEKKKKVNVLKRNADAVDEKIAQYMSLSCELCSESFSTLAALKSHYRIVHQEKGYATCCNKKFYKRYLLVDHIDLHLNPEHFKCDLCDKTFSVSDCLKKHTRDIHETEKKIYYCDQCPKQFIRKTILTRHKAYHLPVESWQFPCEECEKIFPSKFYLSSHKQFSHNSIPTKVCYVCGKVVPTNRYKRHMQMHDSNYKVEKVECEICKAKLNKKYINIHRQHHKEAEKEEFYCTICNHKSPNRRALYIHMRYTHAGQRNHECQVCHKTFKRKLALRQHMGTHTGDNLYSCPYCPKTFTYDSNFYIHKKKEHPKEIEIEKQNKKRTNFKQHMEKASKEAEEILESTKSLDIVHDEQIV